MDKYTEENLHKEAKEQTLETLPEFLNNILNNSNHNRETIIKAVSICGYAIMCAVNKQSETKDEEYLREINYNILNEWVKLQFGGDVRLINFYYLAIPEYREMFTCIDEDVWNRVKKFAWQYYNKYCSSLSDYTFSHIMRMRSNNEPPYGYRVIKKDNEGNKYLN